MTLHKKVVILCNMLFLLFLSLMISVRNPKKKEVLWGISSLFHFVGESRILVSLVVSSFCSHFQGDHLERREPKVQLCVGLGCRSSLFSCLAENLLP